MVDQKFLYPNEPISFSIEKRTYQKLTKTGRKKIARNEAPLAGDWKEVEFGSRYGGIFIFRVPSLADQAEMAKLLSIRLASRGQLDATSLPADIRQMEYVFALHEICGEDQPQWFNKDKLWSGEDMLAVAEVGIVFNEQLTELKKKLDSDSQST